MARATRVRIAKVGADDIMLASFATVCLACVLLCVYVKTRGVLVCNKLVAITMATHLLLTVFCCVCM